MKSILIVTSVPASHEPIVTALHATGHATHRVSNGPGALSILNSTKPDLIVLDIEHPQLHGLAFLERLRQMRQWKDIPVVLLADQRQRTAVLSAAELGVNRYLLKPQLTTDELLRHIMECLTPIRLQGPMHSSASECVVRKADPIEGLEPQLNPDPPLRQRIPAAIVETALVHIETIQKLALPAASAAPLNREDRIRSLRTKSQSKVLAGAIAEVIAIANSPTSTAVDLSMALKRDVALTERVLRLANGTARCGSRISVTTVEHAVTAIGFTAVRNMACAIGVFDALSGDRSESLLQMRMWQHSLAVAWVMDAIIPATESDAKRIGYLVGLCHDLALLVADELLAMPQGLPPAIATDVAPHPAPSDPLSREQAVELVLSSIGLPPEIVDPIREFVASREGQQSIGSNVITRALRLGSYLSHGTFLAWTCDASVAPITEFEWRGVTGNAPVPTLDIDELRREVALMMTLLFPMHFQTNPSLSGFRVPPQRARLFYLRHEAYVGPDPLRMALGDLTQICQLDHLPLTTDALLNCAGIVVVTPSTGLCDDSGMCDLLEQASAASIPTLILCECDVAIEGLGPAVQATCYPIALTRLGEFVKELRKGLHLTHQSTENKC